MTKKRYEIGAFERAWATATSPAPFPTPQNFTVGNVRGAVGAGVEVWWYSPRYGWHYTWRTNLPFTYAGGYTANSCY